MPFFLTLICLISATLCYAQKPEWIRNAEKTSDAYAEMGGKRIAVHPDGSVFVLGQYGGSPTLDGESIVARPNTTDDGFLAKFNPDGDLIWIRQIFESTERYVNRVIDIKVDHMGDLVFSGACFLAHQCSWKCTGARCVHCQD